jgi:hypothetical protein
VLKNAKFLETFVLNRVMTKNNHIRSSRPIIRTVPAQSLHLTRSFHASLQLRLTGSSVVAVVFQALNDVAVKKVGPK